MQYVYIGLFDTLFQKLFDALLKPIVTFLGSLLSTVFSWLFNNVLSPLLQHLAIPIFKILLDLVVKSLSGIFYSILAEILKLVDYMEKAFRIVVGLDPVLVKLDGASVWARVMGVESSSGYTRMPITEAFFSFSGVHTVYWMLNFIGLTLVMLFATIGVARSAFDLDFEGKRPVSRVLSSLFRAVVNLFTIQLVIMFILKLASAILKGIDLATSQVNGGSMTSLGRMVFTMASLDACKIKSLNISSTASKASLTDEIRRSYYYRICPAGQNFNIYDFTNSSDVELNFNLAKMDYLIGYIVGLFLLIIMGACLIVFVQRLMDMLLLYIASPFFVSTIPLDDGEKFGKWRELFIGKCFSGFGMVMAMQLYVMLCPLIMDSGFRMSENSLEFDYLCKMLFLVGGAWAILKSGTMITGLLSETAANAEGQTASLAAAMGIQITRKAVEMGGSMMVSGAKFLASSGDKDTKDGASDGGGKSGSGESGRFGGGSSQKSGSSGMYSMSGGSGKSGSSDKKSSSKTRASGKKASSEKSMVSQMMSAQKTSSDPNTSAAKSTGSKKEARPDRRSKTAKQKLAKAAETMIELADLSKPSKKEDGSNASAVLEPSEGLNESEENNLNLQEEEQNEENRPFFEPVQKSDKRLASSLFGGLFKQYVYRDTNNPRRIVGRGMKVNLGRLFSYEKGPKGHAFKMFGMGLRFSDGAINKVDFGLGSISRMKGTDGKLHVSRVKVMGCKVRADRMTGKKKLTDASPIGLHMTIGEDGHRKLTDLSLIGLHRGIGEDGQYHTTNLMGGIYKHYQAPEKQHEEEEENE